VSASSRDDSRRGATQAGCTVRVVERADIRSNTTAAGVLACAYGEPWLGDHPLCRARLDRDLAGQDPA
jgi:hypothetical protein